MIIDCHTHISEEQSYKDYYKKVKASKIISIACLEKDKEFAELPEILKFASTKKNVYVLGTVDILKDIKNQLRTHEELFKARKIVGIKLYPGYKYFYMNDKRIFPVAELCLKYNKPLVFHSGDTYGGKAILKYSNPIFADELAIRYPNLKMVISHFGFPNMLETAGIVSKNKNVYTDISGTITDVDTKQKEKDIKNMTKQYIQDLKRVFAYYPNIKNKILYGTDYTKKNSALNQIIPYVEVAKKVFSKKEQNGVFYKLAENLYFD